MDKPNFPFPDVAKMFEQFKLPGVDMSALVEARRKDIEALTLANRQALEGVQAMAKRQTEILQQTMAEWQQSAQGLVGKDLGAGAAHQTEVAKAAIEKALANMREMAEMATRSQTQAFETVNKRFQENLAELRKVMGQGK